MKQQYAPPTLVEYGRLDELTLGASGPKVDTIFINGQLIVDVDNPTCDNNLPIGLCVRLGSS